MPSTKEKAPASGTRESRIGNVPIGLYHERRLLTMDELFLNADQYVYHDLSEEEEIILELAEMMSWLEQNPMPEF